MVYREKQLFCEIEIFRLLFRNRCRIEILCDLRLHSLDESLVIIDVLVKLIVCDKRKHSCDDRFYCQIFLVQIFLSLFKLYRKPYFGIDFE